MTLQQIQRVIRQGTYSKSPHMEMYCMASVSLVKHAGDTLWHRCDANMRPEEVVFNAMVEEAKLLNKAHRVAWSK